MDAPDDYPFARGTMLRPAGVPRKFGVGTILVMTAFYAVVIGSLERIGFHWGVTVLVCLLFFLIGLFQFLFKPRNARLASVAAGVVFMLLLGLGLGWTTQWRNAAETFTIGWLGYSIMVGLFIGYIGGVFVASVFLVMGRVEQARMHAMIRRMARQKPPTRSAAAKESGDTSC